MDNTTIVLILAVIAIVLGAIEVVRSRAQSLTAWGVIVLGVAGVLLTQ